MNSNVKLRTNLKVLEHRCNYHEDYSRRDKLRDSVVQARVGGESWGQSAAAVSSLLQDKLWRCSELAVQAA